MGWHLRPLTRCSAYGCGRPATEQLYNAVNAPLNHYCTRHAPAALKEAQRKYEGAGAS